MSTSYLYDAFLSHLPEDAPAMEYLATRLKADGIKVWYEGWEIKKDEDATAAQAKKDIAMNASRVMIQALSAYTTGTNWVLLQPRTFPFRNPQDEYRRFIGVRLDGTRPHYTLDKNILFDWQAQSREKTYPHILHICRPPSGPPSAINSLPLRTLIGLGHAHAINAAVFSGENKLFTASQDSTIRLWNTSTRQCISVFQQDDVDYTHLAVSPDARMVVVAASDQRLRLFDVEAGNCVRVLEGHSQRVNGVVWNPDGRLIASCSADKTVRIWDAIKGECLQRIHYVAELLCIDWSPDGDLLLIGSADGSIYISTPTDELRQSFSLGKSPIRCVAWSPDNTQVLGLAQDHTITIWDRANNVYKKGPDNQDRTVLDMVWGPKGRTILTLATAPKSIGQKLYLDNAETGDIEKELQGYLFDIATIAISRDGRFVFAGTKKGGGELWDLNAGLYPQSLEAHTTVIHCSAINRDHHILATGGEDMTIRLWDMDTGQSLGAGMTGHRKAVTAISWNPKNNDLVSGSQDGALRQRIADNISGRGSVIKGQSGHVRAVEWDHTGSALLTASGSRAFQLRQMYLPDLVREFKGHTGIVNDVKWTPDNLHVVSCSNDHTIRFWEVATGKQIGIGSGHTHEVRSVSCSPDGRHVVSASFDWTIRLWEFPSAKCLQVLEGHREMVNLVTYSHDGRFLASSSYDNSIRLWDMDTGICIHVIKDYLGLPRSLFWSRDSQTLHALSTRGLLYSWDVSALYTKRSAATTMPGQMQYANAKILLVGDSGVGKTALAGVLAGRTFTESHSTDGMLATPIAVPSLPAGGLEREAWLLDFAGQTDYRLTHQLFMEEAAVAVFVFDPQVRNPFPSLIQWDHDLQKATRKPYVRLLVAARTDRGSTILPDDQIAQFMAKYGFRSPLYLTSARRDEGCAILRDAIIEAIDWGQLPTTSSPVLFHCIKQEIMHLREKGQVIRSLAELKQQMDVALPNETFDLEDLRTVIKLLAGPGIIWQLPGDLILLQPEILSRYASALTRKVRQYPGELGCIPEEDLLNGNLDYQDSTRLPAEEENIILWTLYETMIRREWIIRQPTDKKMLLIFPGYSRRRRPGQKDQPDTVIAYQFHGATEDIFTTLVVRLHHTSFFSIDQLWQDSAGFNTHAGKRVGITLIREPEGSSRLEVWAEQDTDENSLFVFLRYIYDHLVGKAFDVVRLQQVACPNPACGEYGRPYSDQARINKALAPNRSGKVFCTACGTSIPLLTTLEEEIDSDEIIETARKEADLSFKNISSENKESIQTGHVEVIAGYADHFFRAVNKHDHGIDGEIEFRDRNGKPSGMRVYLQLKSGDSHLRWRKKDGIWVFDVKNANWVDYWKKQLYPVMLVIRDSGGDIWWMDVSAWLHQAEREGKKEIRQIPFRGERFTVDALHRWRDKLIG